MEFKKLQEALVAQARASYKKDAPLSDRVISAFLETPRHEFVKRYRNYGDDSWHEIRPENIVEHLPVIYQDQPIVIWGSNKDFGAKVGQSFVSTISQPSFVLHMLDLLDLQAGQRVFELGTASGWNAALISRLVGPTGKVITTEIIPELAAEASHRLRQLGYSNIRVLSGDGADGSPEDCFDRVAFTAGAFDFPRALFDQTRIGGLVLFVLKNKGGTDNLYLLRKHEDRFESEYSQACGFVPVTGKAHLSEMEEKELPAFLERYSLSKDPVKDERFWWGSAKKAYFSWYTAALRGFLSLSSNFEAFQLDGGEEAFGWFEEGVKSLAVARSGQLLSYGTTKARDSLIDQIKLWIDVGMPTLSNMRLRIYRFDHQVGDKTNGWISRRPNSTFVWDLPKD